MNFDEKFNLIYVDDDPLAIAHMQQLVRPYGDWISAQFFGSPTKAIAAHQEAPANIVISDLRLGTTTGLEVLKEMKAIAPDQAYFLVSGDADLSAALEAVNVIKAMRFFVKPLDKQEFEAGLLEAKDYLLAKQREKETSLSAAAIERLNLSILTLDQTCKILQTNPAAEKILSQGRIIRRNSLNKLECTDKIYTDTLETFVKNEFYNKQKDEMPMICFDKERESRLIFHPISSDESGVTQKGVTLMVRDPLATKGVCPKQLAKLLGLSMGEARVVANLCDGLTIEETAKAANLSPSTVRSYLKIAFAKTETSRQAEIVSLALRHSI